MDLCQAHGFCFSQPAAVHISFVCAQIWWNTPTIRMGFQRVVIINNSSVAIIVIAGILAIVILGFRALTCKLTDAGYGR